MPAQVLFDDLKGSSFFLRVFEGLPSVFREAAIAVLEVANERLFAHASVSFQEAGHMAVGQ